MDTSNPSIDIDREGPLIPKENWRYCAPTRQWLAYALDLGLMDLFSLDTRGGNLTTDSNTWCLGNASLGPLIVWGVPLNDNFTRFYSADFDHYRQLTGNGQHSIVTVSDCR